MATKKKAAPRKKAVKPIPEGYHAVTPYLAIKGAAKAMAFYKKAFGAKERMRMDAPGGMIGHAEMTFGDSVVMLADEYPPMDFLSPQSRGGSSVSLHFYVPDCDAVVARAVKAGATVKRPLRDEFYGDRTASLEDPFGHLWHIATHKVELSMAELKKRAAKAMGQDG